MLVYENFLAEWRIKIWIEISLDWGEYAKLEFD